MGAAITQSPSCNMVLKVMFCDGLLIRSMCVVEAAGGATATTVNLYLASQWPGEKYESIFAEFEGRRSTDAAIDEAKYNVDFEAVGLLQRTLAPSMPRAIVFLDMLLCLPI